MSKIVHKGVGGQNWVKVGPRSCSRWHLVLVNFSFGNPCIKNSKLSSKSPFCKKRFEKGIFAEIYHLFASVRLLVCLLPILSQVSRVDTLSYLRYLKSALELSEQELKF